MRCGREHMCGPCLDSTPDEALAICEATYDLLGKISGRVVQRDRVRAVVGEVCQRTDYVRPSGTITQGVEDSLLGLEIETWPLTRMLTPEEIEE